MLARKDNNRDSCRRNGLTFVWMRRVVVAVLFSLPYVLLAWLSVGSGWSYPALRPDRLDFRPWSHFLDGGSSLVRAAATSAIMSPCVATASTIFGLLIGRQVQKCRGIWLFLSYLPFASSPVVIGICLLDLFIRLGLDSTFLGIFLIQSVFASGFAVVLFCELWSEDIHQLEQLVETLGGSNWLVWRHAILPRLWPLVLVCWIQTMLYSWLDYGLVSTVGGGIVPSLTLGLVSYIREASVNQAAQSALILILPPIVSLLLAAQLLRRHRFIGIETNA